MTTRQCTVRAHTRSLPDRLDTPKHRELAEEVASIRDVKLTSELADELSRELSGFDPREGA